MFYYTFGLKPKKMIKQFPTIYSDNFRLRQIIDLDLDHIYHGLSHPEVIKYYGVSFKNKEATKEQMAWYKNLEKEEKGLWWAIENVATEQFVGAGGYNAWNHKDHNAEIGFWLLPEFWGQGIMKETFPLIIEYGHKSMNLMRIEGFVDSSNENCKKALAKVDFQYEGTMRDCELKNGKYNSIDIYSSLSPFK